MRQVLAELGRAYATCAVLAAALAATTDGHATALWLAVGVIQLALCIWTYSRWADR